MKPIPTEVKSLFIGSHPTHWEIIEHMLNHKDVKVRELYKVIDDTEEYIKKCINDLMLGGWLRQMAPIGVDLDETDRFIVNISKFSEVALKNMLKCMDMSSYE